MDRGHRRILTERLSKIQESVRLIGGLPGDLISRNILSKDELEAIKASSHSEKERILELVEHIKRNPADTAFPAFIECLKQNGYRDVAEGLEEDEEELSSDLHTFDESTKRFVESICGKLPYEQKMKLYRDLILKSTYVEEKHERKKVASEFRQVQRDLAACEKQLKRKDTIIQDLQEEIDATKFKYDSTVHDLSEKVKENINQDIYIRALQHQIHEKEKEIKAFESEMQFDEMVMNGLMILNQVLEKSLNNNSEKTTSMLDEGIQKVEIAMKRFKKLHEDNLIKLQELNSRLDSIKCQLELPVSANDDDILAAIKSKLDDQKTVVLQKNYNKIKTEKERLEHENTRLCRKVKELEQSSVSKTVEKLRKRVSKLESDKISLEGSVFNLKRHLSKEKRRASETEERNTEQEEEDGFLANGNSFPSSAYPNSRQYARRSSACDGYCLICRKEIFADEDAVCLYHVKAFRGKVWPCCGETKNAEGCRSRDAHLFDSQPRKMQYTTR